MGNVFSNPIVQYIIKHPIKTAVHVVSATLMLGSSVIAPPLLAVAGFTQTGIAAGSLAAATQSVLGNVVAGGMFATLQSAAMGGYGAAFVTGALSGAAVAVEASLAVASAGEEDANGGDDKE